MKILIVGLGSIGKRYARLLKENYDVNLAAFRSGKNEKGNDLGIMEFNDWTEVIKFSPSVVLITNPTSNHINTIIKCVQLNCPLFIEKPIGSDLNQIEELKDLIIQNKIVTYIAYNLRFHPVVQELKNYCSGNELLYYRSICTSYLPDWRSGIDHKKHYSSIRKEGGGVILELSHEIDLAHYLLDGLSSLTGNSGKCGDVTNDAEDYANIMFDSSKGKGSIHLNFFSHSTSRRIDIDFMDYSVSGDLINNTVSEYKNGEEVSLRNYDLKRDDIYLNQLNYFFDNINNYKMNNNFIEATELYKKIIHYRESSFHE